MVTLIKNNLKCYQIISWIENKASSKLTTTHEVDEVDFFHTVQNISLKPKNVECHVAAHNNNAVTLCLGCFVYFKWFKVYHVVTSIFFSVFSLVVGKVENLPQWPL